MSNKPMITYEESEDTIVISYDEALFKSLPEPIAHDMLCLIMSKFGNYSKFLEFEPAAFANNLLTPLKSQEIDSKFSSNFSFFRSAVMRAINNNATTDPVHFLKVLDELYANQKVIDSVVDIKELVKYRVNDFVVELKDLSFIKQFSPSMAMDIPVYICEYLNVEYARKKKSPIVRIHQSSVETNNFRFDNYANATPIQPFSYLTSYVKAAVAETSFSIDDLLLTLKVVDAINQNLTLEKTQHQKRRM